MRIGGVGSMLGGSPPPTAAFLLAGCVGAFSVLVSLVRARAFEGTLVPAPTA